MRYSSDLREKVINYIEEGGLVERAAKKFEVGVSTIYKWRAKGDDYKEYRKPGPKQRRKIDIEKLQQEIDSHPDRQQKEHAETFGVNKSTICRAMKSLKVSRKKNVGLPRKKTGFETKVS